MLFVVCSLAACTVVVLGSVTATIISEMFCAVVEKFLNSCCC